MPSPKYSILIVNPNSTKRMTDALRPVVEPLLPKDTIATYFTAPPPSPASIDDPATSRLSAEICLPHLLPLRHQHDAFIIACYSAHPLIPALRKETQKPVVGIFEASVYHSLALIKPEETFGIVTTGRVWEGLLRDGVKALLGGDGRLRGVESTGFSAVELEEAERAVVEARIREATRRLVKGDGGGGGAGDGGSGEGQGRVGAVCLGCAGMVGFDRLVREEVGDGVRIVDGVKAAVGIVRGMLGCGYA